MDVNNKGFFAPVEQDIVVDPEKHPHFYTWTWDVMVSGGKWRAEYGWKKPEGYDFANLQPLYTTASQREPLTQKQLDVILGAHELNMVRGKDRDDLLAAMRDVEAAHGIKEEA